MKKARIRVTTQLGTEGISIKRIHHLSKPLAEVKASKQRRRRALIAASLFHAIALVALWYFTNPTYPIEDAIHVEMVNEILEKREIEKPKRVITPRNRTENALNAASAPKVKVVTKDCPQTQNRAQH